jgi:hypothetical protein
VTVGEDGKVCLTKMNEGYNLKDEVRVLVDKLNPVMIEQAAEEIVGREPESTLEKGFRDNNFICIQSWDFFIHSRPPLEDGEEEEDGC